MESAGVICVSLADWSLSIGIHAETRIKPDYFLHRACSQPDQTIPRGLNGRVVTGEWHPLIPGLGTFFFGSPENPVLLQTLARH